MSPRARATTPVPHYVVGAPSLRPDHPVDRELLRVPAPHRAAVMGEVTEMILCVRERPSSAARIVVAEYLRDPARFLAHVEG